VTLAPGQQLVGRVVSAGPGQQYVLAVGGARLALQSSQTLTLGQTLTLDVIRVGDTAELRVRQPVGPQAPAPAERAGLAVLAQAAGAVLDDRPPAPDIRALVQQLAAVQAGQSPAGAPLDLAALAALLAPLATALAPAALAAALRDRLRSGGLLFEARLRALLSARPGLSAEDALALLEDDARVRLGQALGLVDDGPAGERDGEEPEPPTPPAVDLARRECQRAARHLLSQQILTALPWVGDGTFRIEVPLGLPSGAAHAVVQLTRDADEGGEAGREPVYSLTVQLQSCALGAVEGHARWRGRSVRALFFVERQDTRDWLAGSLEPLRAGLSGAFSDVQADVRLEPGRAVRGVPAGGRLDLPSGSIVNRRA
jgi:hypothetical protein